MTDLNHIHIQVSINQVYPSQEYLNYNVAPSGERAKFNSKKLEVNGNVLGPMHNTWGRGDILVGPLIRPT